MPMTREQIRQDTFFDGLTEAILERDQPRTTDLYFQMVARQRRSAGDALGVLTTAEAPFVQVPSHINVRDGQITLVNNDHTILGLRTSAGLTPFLPEAYRLLPLLQSVWYVPAGLDIWNQLLGRYPGRYATMKGMVVPPPSYGPVVWNQDQDPITPEGTTEEKLHAHLIATMSGDVRHSYGLFLGLAADPRCARSLRDQLQFLGLIDLQDTIAGRKARNTGHKALRARAVVELADLDRLGARARRLLHRRARHGRRARSTTRSTMPPASWSTQRAARGGQGSQARQCHAPRRGARPRRWCGSSRRRTAQTVWNLLTAHLRDGKSIQSLGDTIQIGAAELILRTTVPRQFTDGQHAFDYCNAANSWLRTSDNPYQARVLYLMASFVNDAARANKLFTSVIEGECAGFDLAGRGRRRRCSRSSTRPSSRSTSRAARRSPAPISKSGADRRAFQAAVAVTACKFQDDPHNQKITLSAYEEYGQSSSHLRDRLLLAAVRLLAGWPKMPGERECYARFMREWINN